MVEREISYASGEAAYRDGPGWQDYVVPRALNMYERTTQMRRLL